MQGNPRDELTTPVDVDAAKLAALNEKIDEYNAKKHPDMGPRKIPKEIPVIPTDKKNLELYEAIKKMEERSQKKQKATKKNIRIAITAVAVLTIGAGALCALASGHFERAKELDSAISFMDENVLPSVYAEAGFIFMGTDDKGKNIYQYDGAALAKAEGILMSTYQFERDPARLVLQKSLGGAYSNSFLKNQGYQTGDELDQMFVYDANDTFENMNEVKVINHVNELKVIYTNGNFDDYIISNSNQTYEVPTSMVQGEGANNARG